MIEFILENDFISALLAFALVLIPAIIFHELGHLFAAKIIGVNVLEFGIGLPPRMARLFMWKETEFTLNWIPLGGFVRPLGEDLIGPSIEPTESETDKPKHHYVSEREELRLRGVRDENMLSVNEAKPLPRIFFMVAGPFANFFTAIIFFVIVAMIGLPQVIGERVQLIEIPDTSPLATLVETGDAIELINGEYFQNLEEFFDKMQRAQNLTLRSFETRERYTIPYIADFGEARGVIYVVGIAPDSPAEASGLQPGDHIIAVDGSAFVNRAEPIQEFVGITDANAGTPITLTVRRQGEEFDLTLTPRINPPPNTGRIGITISSHYEASGIVYNRIAPQEELIPQSVDVAVPYAFDRFFEVMGLIINIPNQLISGAISPEEARPVSIVGISQVGGQFLQQSVRNNTPGLILDFLALISIFLGFTNLLPLPPLDGGRVLFILIEMVRGKPISPNVEYNIYRFGMIFLLSLGVLIIFYDILNPFVLPS